VSGLVELRRAGDLVLSNLVWIYHRPDADTDLVTGRVHIDAADLHIKQQTRGVYRAMSAALVGIGLEPGHVLHQRVHLRDMRDYGRWINVVAGDFPDWRPATTIFGEGAGLPPGIEIAVEFVASATHKAQPVFAELAAGSTNPFPGATSGGDWIFTSGIAPVTPDGWLVDSYDDLKPFGEISTIAEFEAQGALGRRDERLAAQMLAVYANMERILEAAGGDLDSLVKQNGYVRMHMKSFTPIEAARRSLFKSAAVAPPATTVQVADLGPSDEAMLQFEAIGIRRGATTEPIRAASSATTPYGFYTPVSRAGDVVFTAGELAYSSDIGGVVGAWENDAGRSLVHQARFVARRIAALFAAVQVEPAGIKRLNVYLRDRGHSEAWRRLTLDELVGADPAIVETTVLDCGPYESCLFELDGVGEASRSTR
jgi:enamine deaminase RidA (YjgF/YER057c/UK114 family)